jgi:hypothetical protein
MAPWATMMDLLEGSQLLLNDLVSPATLRKSPSISVGGKFPEPPPLTGLGFCAPTGNKLRAALELARAL